MTNRIEALGFVDADSGHSGDRRFVNHKGSCQYLHLLPLLRQHALSGVFDLLPDRRIRMLHKRLASPEGGTNHGFHLVALLLGGFFLPKDLTDG